MKSYQLHCAFAIGLLFSAIVGMVDVVYRSMYVDLRGLVALSSLLVNLAAMGIFALVVFAATLPMRFRPAACILVLIFGSIPFVTGYWATFANATFIGWLLTAILSCTIRKHPRLCLTLVALLWIIAAGWRLCGPFWIR